MAGSRPFVRLSSGAAPGSPATTPAKARLGTATTTSSASATGAASTLDRLDPAQVGARRVARVAAGAGDQGRLLGVTAGEHDLVPPVAQQRGERRAPRACSDDDGSHSLFLKSIETGTPSSSNRLRSSFSTQ